MAQLDKNAYYRKMIYAGKKMAANKEIQTLTEEQHDALSQMCSARHELHTNMDRITKGSEQDYLGSIIEANGALGKSGLPIIDGIPTDTTDYIDIDSIRELEDLGEAPSRDDEDEWQEWYDAEYHRIYDELSKLNKKIEKYLEQIDAEHGTHYAPTGASRIF